MNAVENKTIDSDLKRDKERTARNGGNQTGDAHRQDLSNWHQWFPKHHRQG
jgi:hypothetical protein